MNWIRENALLIYFWGLLSMPLMFMLFPLQPDIGISLGVGIWFISVIVILIAFTDEAINKDDR